MAVAIAAFSSFDILSPILSRFFLMATHRPTSSKLYPPTRAISSDKFVAARRGGFPQLSIQTELQATMETGALCEDLCADCG